MQFGFRTFITDPFVLIFLSVVSGLILGEVRIGRFSLGTSGGLFTGLFFGWYIYASYALPYKDMAAADVPKYASAMLSGGVVPSVLFDFSLILFVAAVGLLASKDLGTVVKRYGAKFILLGFAVTLAGAGGIFLLTRIFPDQNPYAVSGVYTGALTSSPGLAAAIESVAKYGGEAQAQVGYGHAVGYAPGVLIVIIAMQFFPLIFRIDIEKEKERFHEEIGAAENASTEQGKVKEVGFDIIAFFLACFLGYFVGSVKLYLGPAVKYFSLGSTGGILVTSLVLGFIGKIGPLNFRMDTKVLGVIREIGLAMFLAIVGLRYGYDTVNSLLSSGAMLAMFSFVDGLFAIIVGYVLGRYVFKLNWIILAGALCGGMTSTPGLGAAIDSTKSDDVASGYGATYPFALLGMVVFTILLHTFV